MRKITIIGALLAGLIGLFMSLCGGGFFLVMAYNSVTNIIRSGQQDQMFGVLVLLVIPAGFAVCGAALFWACFKFIRRRDDRSQEQNGER
jgi:membrane protein implicated in regulation of membrane protease activity